MAEVEEAAPETAPPVNPPVHSEMQRLEELFKERYSETDTNFMQYMRTRLPDPPCVENWYVRPKRSFDWAR